MRTLNDWSCVYILFILALGPARAASGAETAGGDFQSGTTDRDCASPPAKDRIAHAVSLDVRTAILGDWTYDSSGTGDARGRNGKQGDWHGSSYTFDADGTFVRFAMGSGSIVAGEVATAGRYWIDGDRIHFTGQTETKNDLFNDRNRYFKRPRPDDTHYFLFRETATGDIELAIEQSGGAGENFHWHGRGGWKR